MQHLKEVNGTIDNDHVNLFCVIKIYYSNSYEYSINKISLVFIQRVSEQNITVNVFLNALFLFFIYFLLHLGIKFIPKC